MNGGLDGQGDVQVETGAASGRERGCPAQLGRTSADVRQAPAAAACLAAAYSVVLNGEPERLFRNGQGYRG